MAKRGAAQPQVVDVPAGGSPLSVRWSAPAALRSAGRPTAEFVRFTRRFLAPVLRLAHRPTLDGVQNLPTSAPYLLVANHSAGLGIAEILAFAVLYIDQVGADRALAGFAHPFGFRLFPASRVLQHVGAVPSTYEAARAALAEGVALLVFPGGDHETMRPVWQAKRVDFGGRKGFLRIARERRVAIVPMGIRGSHYTAPVLWRSRLLPKLLLGPWLIGLKRWPLTLLGVLVAVLIVVAPPLAWPWRVVLAYLWLGSPFIFIPWIPWTIRMRIGVPMPPDALFDGVADDAQLGNALRRVERAVQALVESVDEDIGSTARSEVRPC